METQKAILIVSVGTSHIEALENTTYKLGQKMAEHFSEYKLYYAFSNQLILNKMKEKRQGMFLSIKEALEQMLSEGIEEALVQPTYILNGIENAKMLEEIAEYREQFIDICIGNPLLSAPEDYKKTLHAILKNVDLEENEVLVLVGHGSSHKADMTYQKLEDMAHELGIPQVFAGTIGGSLSFTHVMERLEKQGSQKVCLMPFLFVLGNHAKKDIAAETNSWKSMLAENGYKVRIFLKGLGEIEDIQELLIAHLEEKMKKEG